MKFVSNSNDLRIVSLTLCLRQRQSRASSNDDACENSRRLLLSAWRLSGPCGGAPDDNRCSWKHLKWQNTTSLRLKLEILAADNPRLRKSMGYICLMRVISIITYRWLRRQRLSCMSRKGPSDMRNLQGTPCARSSCEHLIY